MAQTDDDLKTREVVPIQERTEEEKRAYIEGYEAAVQDIRRASDRLQAAANLARSVNL